MTWPASLRTDILAEFAEAQRRARGVPPREPEVEEVRWPRVTTTRRSIVTKGNT